MKLYNTIMGVVFIIFAALILIYKINFGYLPVALLSAVYGLERIGSANKEVKS